MTTFKERFAGIKYFSIYFLQTRTISYIITLKWLKSGKYNIDIVQLSTVLHPQPPRYSWQKLCVLRYATWCFGLSIHTHTHTHTQVYLYIQIYIYYLYIYIGEGNGNPLQCSCLENPRDSGAWWAAVYGVTQSRTRLKWLSSSSIHIYILIYM